MEGTDEPVAVTGAGGFVGLAVCRRLVADGREVVGLDIAQSARRRVEAAGARFASCDVTDAGETEHSLADVPRDARHEWFRDAGLLGGG